MVIAKVTLNGVIQKTDTVGSILNGIAVLKNDDTTNSPGYFFLNYIAGLSET